MPPTIANRSMFQAIDSRSPTCHPDVGIDAGLRTPIRADSFLTGATSRRAVSGYVRGCAVSDSHPALAASFWPKLHQLTKGGHDQIRMCNRLRMSSQC